MLSEKDDVRRSEPACPVGRFISESHYIDENFHFLNRFHKGQSKK